MEKKIEDLKFQISSSDLIISELESKVKALKEENKESLSKLSNNTSKNRTEINNRPPLVPNARGAGRKSIVDENTLSLINFQ